MWLVILGIIPLIIAILIKKFLNKKKLEAKETINDYYYTNGSLDDGAMCCYVIIMVLIFVGVIFFGKARYDTIFCEIYLWNLFGCYIEL